MSHEPRIIEASGLQPKPIRWIWKKYVAQGHLSIIEGKPGIGTTALCCAAASAVTQRNPRGRVLILDTGADHINTLQERLEKAGAAPKLLYFYRPVDNLSNEIGAAIAKVDPALVIVDPVANAEELRALSTIADQHNCAVLCTTRRRAVANTARIHLHAVFDPAAPRAYGKMPGCRYISIGRSNIGPAEGGRAFEVDDNGVAIFPNG